MKHSDEAVGASWVLRGIEGLLDEFYSPNTLSSE